MMYLNILRKGVKRVLKLVFTIVMNKKQAIAYAQIALNYLQSSNCNKEITLENLALEMKGAFKIYSRDVAVIMANNMVEVEREFDGKHK